MICIRQPAKLQPGFGYQFWHSFSFIVIEVKKYNYEKGVE
jgi:hypothetical protein